MPELSGVLENLDELAPLRLSASWDNTGLLLQGRRNIRSALVTIDLSEAVVAEALGLGVDLVIAYHPPIFSGLKRLTEETARGRGLLALARDGVHLYSPHTALDAVAGGINDWLLEAFGGVVDVTPITPDAGDPLVGMGRTATLEQPGSVTELTQQVKSFLGLSGVRLAGNPAALVERVAVCPGAGGSAFEGLSQVDLLLTGEMRHHDVLGFAERGVATILTDHTNTERGYLPRYAARVGSATGIEVHVSTVDADPLRIV